MHSRLAPARYESEQKLNKERIQQKKWTLLFQYEVGRVESGPKYPGPVDAFDTPTNRQKMNLIRTLFVLHLSKHRPGPVLTLEVGQKKINVTVACFSSN